MDCHSSVFSSDWKLNCNASSSILFSENSERNPSNIMDVIKCYMNHWVGSVGPGIMGTWDDGFDHSTLSQLVLKIFLMVLGMHQDRPILSFPYENHLDQEICCYTHLASLAEFPQLESTHLRLPTMHHRYHPSVSGHPESWLLLWELHHML